MTLLVVDTQKGIIDDTLYQFNKLKMNIKTLLNIARDKKIEVIYVRHDDGLNSGFSFGDKSFEIYEEFKPKESEKIFTKEVNSAFHESTGLLKYLKVKNESKIIIVGIRTDLCIDATIKSGFEHGFELFIPEYTNSTIDNQYISKEILYKYFNEYIWPIRYGNCMSMEKIVSIMSNHF